MKPYQLSGHYNLYFIKALFVSFCILSPLSLIAQTPTNFTGKWEFDKAASDKTKTGDASFNGKIILEIKQNSATIECTNTFFVPGKEGIVMSPDIYTLDGKVTADKSGTDPAKKFVKWSQDKKTITTNYVMTATIDGVAQDFLAANTYKLSDDGKTLVIEEFHKSKLNGEKTIKKVYKKKM